MNPQAHIKVVLIDDHALVRDGIRALLMAVPELDVVGEAGSGAEAFDLLKRVPADVVLMDIGLKDINGLELTQSLRRDFPDIRVLILSMYDNQEYVNTSVKVGARGYVLKDAPSREIIVAIEAIAAGGTYYSEGVAEKLANHSAEERELTPREREVLLMLAQGHNNKTMARALQISVRTVETHRLSIRRKLDIDRPADLMKHAMVHGWPPGQHEPPHSGSTRLLLDTSITEGSVALAGRTVHPFPSGCAHACQICRTDPATAAGLPGIHRLRLGLGPVGAARFAPARTGRVRGLDCDCPWRPADALGGLGDASSSHHHQPLRKAKQPVADGPVRLLAQPDLPGRHADLLRRGGVAGQSLALVAAAAADLLHAARRDRA